MQRDQANSLSCKTVEGKRTTGMDFNPFQRSLGTEKRSMKRRWEENGE